MTKMGDRKLSGGIPPSALGTAGAPADVKTKLAEAREKIARGDFVELPGGLGRVWMELVGHDVSNKIEAATFREMDSVGLPPIPLHSFSYDIQRQARTLARACRDPEDPKHETPFGTLEEWSNETDSVILACALVYKDLRDKLDPFRIDLIDADDLEDLELALKKKDVVRLRSFGAATLANWLTSGAVQLSSSRTAASSDGPSTTTPTPIPTPPET
jgi:hypothetical protein